MYNVYTFLLQIFLCSLSLLVRSASYIAGHHTPSIMFTFNKRLCTCVHSLQYYKDGPLNIFLILSVLIGQICISYPRSPDAQYFVYTYHTVLYYVHTVHKVIIFFFIYFKFFIGFGYSILSGHNSRNILLTL